MTEDEVESVIDGIFGDPSLGYASNIANEQRATKDPKVMYALIRDRWSDLITWVGANGGAAQFPELVQFISSWQDFKKKWDETSDFFRLTRPLEFQPVDELDDQSDNISKAESAAIRRNYAPARLNIDVDGSIRRDQSDIGKSTGASSPVASPLGKPTTGQVVEVPKTPAPKASVVQTVAKVITDATSNDKTDEKKKTGFTDSEKIGIGVAIGFVLVTGLSLVFRK